MFTIGTAPSIPVMAIYVAYYPTNGEYLLALAVTVIVTLAMLLLTFYCYPSTDNTPKDFFARLVCALRCKDSCYGRHLANGMFFESALSS